MSNNTAFNKSKSSKKRKRNNNSNNNQGRNKKSKVKKSGLKKKTKSKSKSPLSNEDKEKLVESMNEFQTTLLKITKNFETINTILGKVV